MKHDFDDPAIIDMVKKSHEPVENWNETTDGKILRDIRCLECEHVWPCPTILELKEAKKERAKAIEEWVNTNLRGKK